MYLGRGLTVGPVLWGGVRGSDGLCPGLGGLKRSRTGTEEPTARLRSAGAPGAAVLLTELLGQGIAVSLPQAAGARPLAALPHTLGCPQPPHCSISSCEMWQPSP